MRRWVGEEVKLAPSRSDLAAADVGHHDGLRPTMRCATCLWVDTAVCVVAVLLAATV
jgi:hypothetical protein